jgi:hypothetical protein
MHLEILSNICNKIEVESIHTCINENKFSINESPVIQESERFLGIITEKFATKQKITWEKINLNQNFIKKKNSKSLIDFRINFEKVISFFYNLFLSFVSRDKITILLTSTGYNVESLSEKLNSYFPKIHWITVSRETAIQSVSRLIYFRILKIFNKPKGCSIVPLPIGRSTNKELHNSGELRKLEKKLEEILKILEENAGYFSYRNVSFTEIFFEKIEKDLIQFVKSFHQDFLALKKIIKTHNVKLCLSPFARQTALVAGELCQKKGIPTLIISHGTLKAPKNQLEEIEYRHLGESLLLSKIFEFAAVQTPSEGNFCRYFNIQNTIRTGPLIFSKPDKVNKKRYLNSLVGKIDNKTRVIFYPENTRPRSGTRFHVFETFDEFLSSASDLINAVNELESVHLVIKPHPVRKMDPKEIKALLPESNKLTILSPNKPFFESLTIADLVIGFSSTAIEDALQSHIPVLLLDKWNRYMHLRAEKININKEPQLSPIYYINNSKNLKYGIQWILNNHLNKKIPKSIFDEYVFQENYFKNLIEFIDSKIGRN